MEHMRPEGLSQGYFCARCGAPGINMYGTGHGPGQCDINAELVKELFDLNRPEHKKKIFRAQRCQNLLVGLGKHESHPAHQWTIIEDLGTGRQFNTYVCLGRDHYVV